MLGYESLPFLGQRIRMEGLTIVFEEHIAKVFESRIVRYILPIFCSLDSLLLVQGCFIGSNLGIVNDLKIISINFNDILFGVVSFAFLLG